MVANETKPTKDAAERVVVVDRTKYRELLVSRRKLERVGEHEDRLHDRETHEIFVVEEDDEVGLARNA
jgi:hypothetical protein